MAMKKRLTSPKKLKKGFSKIKKAKRRLGSKKGTHISKKLNKLRRKR